MSTFTAAPGATGGQPAWVQNARARGGEETTPQGGGVGVDFIPTAEHAAGLDETETHISRFSPSCARRASSAERIVNPACSASRL
jgi:hypothetical protein